MKFTPNLIAVIIKVLSAVDVSFSEIDELAKSERLLLIVFLNKRNLVSDEDFDHIAQSIDSAQNLRSLLLNCRICSSLDKRSLTKSILNRLIRKCFSDWLQRTNFGAIDAKTAFCDRKVNQKFWADTLTRHVFPGPFKESGLRRLFSEIRKNYRINQKPVRRRKRIRKPPKGASVKQPKYLSLIFKNDLRWVIMKLISRDVPFKRNFNEMKKCVLQQYSSQNGWAEDVAPPNDPFQVRLRKSVVKVVQTISSWLQKIGWKLELINARTAQTALKYVRVPPTKWDYFVSLYWIEKHIDEGQF